MKIIVAGLGILIFLQAGFFGLWACAVIWCILAQLSGDALTAGTTGLADKAVKNLRRTGKKRRRR